MLSLLISPILSLSVAALPQAESERDKDDIGTPPGTVALKGGRTPIGVDKKDIQKLVTEVSGASKAVRALDAETPEHKVDVAPFHMGLTEVTNEQYHAFVRATGHRPPEEWGRKAIDDATREFLVDVGKQNQQRRLDKEPLLPTIFDRPAWWSENWKEAEWAIPAGQELHPVTYVDFSDVLAYCRWAGVRPPTEFEYQHAVRGTRSSQAYPWGEEWPEDFAEHCSTSEDKKHNSTRPVGTFPNGCSSDGLFELAGNVWEWTSSPYIAYDGFKKGTYKLDGSKEKLPEPMWDGNQRVVVGGCYQTSRLVARCTVRRPTERSQMTNALGFRIAASTRTGVDIASAIFELDVRNSEHRPSGVSYMPNLPAGMDRWDWAEGAEGTPEGYEIITGYEYMLFVPVEQLVESDDVQFRRATLIDPQHLGFLSTSAALLDPALGPGTYLIAFRGAGDTIDKEDPADDKDKDKDKADKEGEGDEAQDPEAEKPANRRRREDPWADILDITKDNLLLYDITTGELVGHVEVEGIKMGKGKGGGKVEQVTRQFTVLDPQDPKGEETIVIEEEWLQLSFLVPNKLDDSGLPLSLFMKPEPEVFEKNWRR